MKNRLGSTIALCAALVLWCGSVRAEKTGPSPSDGAPPRTATASASSQAALDTAEAQVSWMSLRSDHVFRWLRAARGRGDLPRSRCLDEKVSEAHAVERQGREALAAIRRAVGQGDDGYGHHLARLQRLGDRSNQLMASAHRCGQKISRRPRLPTIYRVKMIEPKLPPLDQSVRTAAKRARPSTGAQARR